MTFKNDPIDPHLSNNPSLSNASTLGVITNVQYGTSGLLA